MRKFVVMPVPQGGDFELPTGSFAWIDGEVFENMTWGTYVQTIARVGLPTQTRGLRPDDLVMTEAEIRACPYGATAALPVWA